MTTPTLPPSRGQRAPDFHLPDQNNILFSLSGQQGQWVVIYFYPKAMTPGCTDQACALRDTSADFSALQVQIVGISPDEPSRLSAFATRESLGFTLLSDRDHNVAVVYGAWQEKSMYGRRHWGFARMTYIIDPSGVIRAIFPNVSPKTHTSILLNWFKEYTQ